MKAKDTVMTTEQLDKVWAEPLINTRDRHDIHIAQAQAEISFKAGKEKEAKGLHKVVDFAYGVAKAMDDSKSSHVFFILQQAFGRDMEWDDVQEILTVIIEQSQAKLKEWGIE